MAAVKRESLGPSPVLFLNAKGEPMRFFIRPGPTKMQLQPLIQDGGGVLCRTQEPNVILLADPGENSAGTDGAGQFYISTQYIRDCVTQNQQLDMETYRLSKLPAIQTRATSRKQRGSGRMGYSLEDDAAILEFISKRRHEAKGNRVWQQMEQKGVTFHSWQSMKDRFLKHLQFKQTNKSPEKRKKPLAFKDPLSSSSEENSIRSSPRKKKQKTAQIASSSDSDATDVQRSRNEGASADQPEPEPLQNSASPLRPDLEGEVHPCAQSDGVENEVYGDKPDSGSSHEEEQQQRQKQQKGQDGVQPEVSAERDGMDNDGAGEGMSEGPKNQQTTPTEIRRKSPSSKPYGRKLGILERAAREFEDSQMTDDGESQEGRPPSRASSDNSDTNEFQITAARERAIREQQENAEQSSRLTPGPGDDGPAGPVDQSSAALPVTSNAHNFIFDQETQEDLSQSSQRDPPVPRDVLQAKEHVVKLMQDSKKDLVEVMKALLKASGDVTQARSYLLKGYKAEVHGPFWTRRDDEALLSAGSAELDELREKFGEDRVLKRAEFLKAQ